MDELARLTDKSYNGKLIPTAVRPAAPTDPIVPTAEAMSETLSAIGVTTERLDPKRVAE
jgi:hypothetical protein